MTDRNDLVHQLAEIGKSLSTVRDVDRLLDEILKKARFLAGADAGSIYVIEGEADEIQNRKLRFKLLLEFESGGFSTFKVCHQLPCLSKAISFSTSFHERLFELSQAWVSTRRSRFRTGIWHNHDFL